MMNTSPVVKMGGWNSCHQSHHLLLSVYFSEKSSDCSVTKRRKNKAFDLVRARSRCEQKKKKSRENLDTKIALRCLITLTLPLLRFSSYFSTVKFTETHKIQVQGEKNRCAPKKNATLQA